MYNSDKNVDMTVYMKQVLENATKKLKEVLNIKPSPAIGLGVGAIMKQILANSEKKLKEVLNIKPSPVIGLDVGCCAVKMVGLEKNGNGYHVTAAAMSEIEAVDDNGNEPSQRAVVAAIEECLRSSGGSISRNCHFVAGLSGPKVKVSSFNFPSLTLDEVAQAVMFEAAQTCPFDIRSSIVDYQLIGIDKTGFSIDKIGLGRFRKKKKVYPNVKGVLAIAANEEISSKRMLAEDALLKCVLMDSDGLALLNCLEDYLGDDEKLPAAIINVGMSSTTVAILSANGLPFIRDLKYCGSDIIDHIAKGRGVGIDQVLREISEGTGSSGFSADIAPACKDFVRDISETLSYYLVHHDSKVLKHVYVCGDFSLLDALVKVLNDGLDSDVSVWNPFLRMNCNDNIAGSELLDKCGPALAVAAGLAMRRI